MSQVNMIGHWSDDCHCTRATINLKFLISSQILDIIETKKNLSAQRTSQQAQIVCTKHIEAIIFTANSQQSFLLSRVFCRDS